MLTDAQVQVLAAVNDHCEIHERLELDQSEPLPDMLADNGLPDAEIFTAVSDLHQLGLIQAVTVAELNYPVLVTGLTAKGRQELP